MTNLKTALAQATAGVSELNLAGHDFTKDPQDLEQLIDLLSSSSSSSIQALNMSGCKFCHKKDYAKLLNALAFQSRQSLSSLSIVHLDLSNHLSSNLLDAGSAAALSALMTNKSLKSLNLSGQALRLELVMALIRHLPSNSYLTELVLHSCSLDEASVIHIIQAISANKNCGLQVLDLSANAGTTTEFVRVHLSKFLQTSTLQSLILDHSSIFMFAGNHEQDRVIMGNPVSYLQPFWTALETNTTLHHLSLRFCRLPHDMGHALLSTLTVNKTLQVLDLEFTGFGLRESRDKDLLMHLIPQFQGLQEIKLICKYKKEESKRLVQAVRQNSSLTKFYPRLDSPQAALEIQGLLQRNRHLATAHRALNIITTTSLSSGGASAALVPHAMQHMVQSIAGSSATFVALQHWIAECLSKQH